MGNELIGGCSERGMTRRGAILRLMIIGLILLVFSLFKGDIMGFENLEYVAGRMTASKDEMLCVD